MEVAGWVQSCFRPLQHINLQVELQTYKMRGFSLYGEHLLFFHGSPKFVWSLTCLVPHLEHVGKLLCT